MDEDNEEGDVSWRGIHCRRHLFGFTCCFGPI